jgi:hypothetical protein
MKAAGMHLGKRGARHRLVMAWCDVGAYLNTMHAGCRADIMRTYAQQLSDEELRQLAAATAGLSGRDLRDIASRTERSWASKVCCMHIILQYLAPASWPTAGFPITKHIDMLHSSARTETSMSETDSIAFSPWDAANNKLGCSMHCQGLRLCVQIIRNEIAHGELPPAEAYLQAAHEQRQQRTLDRGSQAERLFGALPMTQARSLTGWGSIGSDVTSVLGGVCAVLHDQIASCGSSRQWWNAIQTVKARYWWLNPLNVCM